MGYDASWDVSALAFTGAGHVSVSCTVTAAGRAYHSPATRVMVVKAPWEAVVTSGRCIVVPCDNAEHNKAALPHPCMADRG